MSKELNFVSKCYPLAIKAGERFTMNPLVILAQAALESDYGTSLGARERKNFFGITAAGSKNEFWDGAYSTANNQYKLKFRIYKSEQDSFMDFARLIKQKYVLAHAKNSDYKAYAHAIAYSTYISETNGDNRESYRKGVIARFEIIKTLLEKNGLSEQQQQQA